MVDIIVDIIIEANNCIATSFNYIFTTYSLKKSFNRAGLSNSAGLSNGAGLFNGASPSNIGARPSNTTPRTFYSKAIKSAAGTSYSKIVSSIFYKTPAPKKKGVYYSRQINKNNYFYLLTIKAKYNRIFLYKKALGIKRLKPKYIRLELLFIMVFY